MISISNLRVLADFRFTPTSVQAPDTFSRLKIVSSLHNFSCHVAFYGSFCQLAVFCAAGPCCDFLSPTGYYLCHFLHSHCSATTPKMERNCEVDCGVSVLLLGCFHKLQVLLAELILSSSEVWQVVVVLCTVLLSPAAKISNLEVLQPKGHGDAWPGGQ